MRTHKYHPITLCGRARRLRNRRRSGQASVTSGISLSALSTFEVENRALLIGRCVPASAGLTPRVYSRCSSPVCALQIAKMARRVREKRPARS